MPQIFKIGAFVVYFWSNENNPLEPVHVHVSEGKAVAHATKIWITSSGKATPDETSRNQTFFHGKTFIFLL